uniref:(northern house mosquito) hypothetical protein n=1 Tax=Culex pipiens TaxID=7175 RepID=A0A8D8KLU9_CULPI
MLAKAVTMFYNNYLSIKVYSLKLVTKYIFFPPFVFLNSSRLSLHIKRNVNVHQIAVRAPKFGHIFAISLSSLATPDISTFDGFCSDLFLVFFQIRQNKTERKTPRLYDATNYRLE